MIYQYSDAYMNLISNSINISTFSVTTLSGLPCAEFDTQIELITHRPVRPETLSVREYLIFGKNLPNYVQIWVSYTLRPNIVDKHSFS